MNSYWMTMIEQIQLQVRKARCSLAPGQLTETIIVSKANVSLSAVFRKQQVQKWWLHCGMARRAQPLKLGRLEFESSSSTCLLSELEQAISPVTHV